MASFICCNNTRLVCCFACSVRSILSFQASCWYIFVPRFFHLPTPMIYYALPLSFENIPFSLFRRIALFLLEFCLQCALHIFRVHKISKNLLTFAVFLVSISCLDRRYSVTLCLRPSQGSRAIHPLPWVLFTSDFYPLWTYP